MRPITTLLIIALLAAGCTSSTPYGQCVGVNDEQNPGLIYHYSAWNIGLAVVLWETIVVPLVVVFTQLKCPVADRAVPHAAH